MRWEGHRRSENVEDRRGSRVGVAAGGGIGVLIVGLIIALLTGQDPSQITARLPTGQGPQDGTQQGELRTTPEEEKQKAMIEVVLAWTEDVWTEQFRRAGMTYEKPKLVFFRGAVSSACGNASAAVGPFYCPADKMIYIDLSFFAELERRFKAPGDFAQAYVIAHEVGHHVQNLLGTSAQVQRMERMAGSKAEANQASVRLELQADFYAGVWAHHNEKKHKFMDEGDLEEAIRAAEAIGDDAIQKQSQGYVVPDAFTHGSSRQRIAWFRHGFTTGDLRQGDTFDEALWNRVNPR
jgi:predicted metalloprotease